MILSLSKDKVNHYGDLMMSENLLAQIKRVNASPIFSFRIKKKTHPHSAQNLKMHLNSKIES